MKFENRSGLVALAQAGALSDEEMIVTVAAKATCQLAESRLRLLPPDLSWPIFVGPQKVGMHQFAPEIHYARREVDIHLLGTARSPRGHLVHEMAVVVRSGKLDYQVVVVGDRQWIEGPGGPVPGHPARFTEMPLTPDRAYGGTVRIDDLDVPYPANPHGRGYYADADSALGRPLPNLERPDQRIASWQDQPDPALFLLPLDSTLGLKQRFVYQGDSPIAPTPRMFQSAVPDLIASPENLGPSLLVGGCSTEGPLVYPLPGPDDLPQVHVTVGDREATYRLPVSSIVILADEPGIVLTFQVSFRYLLVPEIGMARGELTWHPSHERFVMPTTEVDDSGNLESDRGLESDRQPGNAPAKGEAAPSRHATPSEGVAVVAPTPTPIPPPIGQAGNGAESVRSSSPRPAPLEPPPWPPSPEPPDHIYIAQPTGVPTLHVAIRRTYRYDANGRFRLAEQQPSVPTEFALYDEPPPSGIPSVRQVSECVFKTGTDVILQGSVHTYGEICRQRDFALQVGTSTHHGLAFGRRLVEVQRGSVRFTEADPLDVLPIRYEFAYGGCDALGEQAFLAKFPEGQLEKAKQMLLGDNTRLSPFLYARNASGKGFVCGETLEFAEGRELPNLEHPRDRLTPERLRCPHPMQWVRQPVPFGCDYLDPQSFVRLAMLGLCPLHAPLSEPYPEVRFDWLPEGFATKGIGELPPSKFETAVHREATRSGSLGLRFPYLEGDEPIELHSIDPTEPRLTFRLPGETPEMRVVTRGREFQLKPHLYTVLIQSETRMVSMIWTGMVPLKRTMMPRELAEIEARVKWPTETRWKPI